MIDASISGIEITPLSGPGAPLNSGSDELSRQGFLEEEFRLSGQAARYRFGEPAADATCIDAGHPYATRLLVRRPRDPSRFNGIVIVEWLNVSTGQDLDFVYAATRDLLWRRGYAWVGVSAQRVGVERLLAWNPARYDGVSVAAPQHDPEDGELLDPPQAFTGAAGGDVLCWDIFSHAAWLLRHRSKSLLGDLRVDGLVAAGESQSAFRLSRYFNAIQPRAGLYDGFLLYDRGGPQPLRADHRAKLIGMGSEFFAEYAGASPSDAVNQRWWDLAGASHVSLAEMEDYIDPQVMRDGVHVLKNRTVSLTAVLSKGAEPGAPPLWSRVPNGDLMKAALHALTRWMKDGVEPPSAPRLQTRRQGESERLVRDADGRALGGVRHPSYEVPSAMNVGVTEEPPKLAGVHLDFTPEEMTRRYGSPERYFELVRAAVEHCVSQGFLLQEDADRVLVEAGQARFSR